MDKKQVIKELQADLESMSRMFFKVLDSLIEDNQQLKLIAFKPSKESAKAYLEYLKWEDCKAKSNFEKLHRNELSQIKEWLNLYCEESHCEPEDALTDIV